MTMVFIRVTYIAQNTQLQKSCVHKPRWPQIIGYVVVLHVNVGDHVMFMLCLCYVYVMFMLCLCYVYVMFMCIHKLVWGSDSHTVSWRSGVSHVVFTQT